MVTPDNILAKSKDPVLESLLNDNVECAPRPKSTQQRRSRSRQFDRLNDAGLRRSQPGLAASALYSGEDLLSAERQPDSAQVGPLTEDIAARNADIPSTQYTEFAAKNQRLASADPTNLTNLDKLRQLRRMRNQQRIVTSAENNKYR